MKNWNLGNIVVVVKLLARLLKLNITNVLLRTYVLLKIWVMK